MIISKIHNASRSPNVNSVLGIIFKDYLICIFRCMCGMFVYLYFTNTRKYTYIHTANC